MFMRAEEFIGLTLVIGSSVFTVIFLMSNSMLLRPLGGAVSLSLPGMIINSKRKSARRNDRSAARGPEYYIQRPAGRFQFSPGCFDCCQGDGRPLITEFSRLLRENRLGKPMDDALNDLLERIENDDLEMLVTALLIQRQVGGNLAEVLDSISHTIRERVRIKGEIRALTAEGRLSALILSLCRWRWLWRLLFLIPDILLL
jgi:tight adherence protein B